MIQQCNLETFVSKPNKNIQNQFSEYSFSFITDEDCDSICHCHQHDERILFLNHSLRLHAMNLLLNTLLTQAKKFNWLQFNKIHIQFNLLTVRF